MTEREFFAVEPRDVFAIRTNKKDDTDDLENVDYQYEIPHWESKFVKMLEQMRTIPYVSLGHFRFIGVQWVDEDEEDDTSIVEPVVVEEEKQPNHWELVKKILFSQAARAVKNQEKSAKVVKEPGKEVATGSEGSSSLASVGRLPSQQKSTLQSGVFAYFRDFIQSRKQTTKADNEAVAEESKEPDDGSPVTSMSFQRAKNLLRQKMNLKKILSRERRKSLIGVEKSKKLVGRSPDKKRTTKKAANRRKDFLFDLEEMSKKKRFQKLNQIMSKDDGPFRTDYRFLLGLEFWASYCGVEKYQLISVCAGDFWSKELASFASGKLADPTTADKSKSQPTESAREFGILKELKQFLKGTNKPGKAPQRVISSEEKFRQLLFHSSLLILTHSSPFFSTQSMPHSKFSDDSNN